MGTASENRVGDAVILAAGGSARMGRPKALLELRGVPLLVAHARAFHAMGLRVTVVLGAHAEAVAAVVPAGVRIVTNGDWARTGPAESAALGLAGLGPSLLTPVDVPPASADDLAALISQYGSAVLTVGGLAGHPVRLDPPHAPGRLDTRLEHATRVPSQDADRLLNLNTPEAWEAWVQARARSGRS